MGSLRVKNICLSECKKKRVLNYEIQNLFIEARRLKKIGTDDQGLNLNASFCEKIEKGMHNHHPKAVRPKPTRTKFSLFRVLFGTSKVLNWPYDTECTYVFGSHLDSSSRVCWPVLVPRHVFILLLSFFISFQDNSGYLRTIILQINTNE